ncbi:acyl-CoA dehydrogenase, C-terminal domain protein [delta proteobacterium NaphS2]|nr:acyl-CoA dehydrogenase, C-terminal domain protein [delta proteobacterium NaphS2]
MENRGFLEKLYQGEFDKALFDACRGSRISDKARAVQNAYLALSREYPPRALEERGEIPKELWEKLKEKGMFALTIPESYGGMGLSLSDYLSIIEVAARADMSLAVIPLAHHSIGLKGLILYGSANQKNEYLPPAATGEMIFAFALTEPETGSDAKHIKTFAQRSRDGSHYILNGTKTYITNGGYAGALTVFAQLDRSKPGFMGAFVVETGSEGVEIGKDMPKMGLTLSSTVSIRFKDVKVPVKNLIGKPGDGFKIAMAILNYGRLGLAAASNGLMAQSAKEMLERAHRRRQFGVSISQFELVQEKILNAQVNAFLSKAITAFTAGMLEQDPLVRVAIESSHAKLFSTTRAWDVLYEALQIHGGSGYLKTLPYEKRLRDFRVTTVFEGTTEIHSIYPPLFMIRSMMKASKGYGGRWALILKSAFRLSKRLSMGHAYDHSVLEKARKKAFRGIRRVRWMLLAGLIYYGRDITKREFFLKRVTELSLQVFILISAFAYIDKMRLEGRNIWHCLDFLKYYLAEIESSASTSSRVRPNLKEKLHRKIFNGLKSCAP